MDSFFGNSRSLGQSAEYKLGSHTVQVKSRIAEGGFGVVDLVVEVHTKKEFILKRCNIDRQESFEVAKKEINMLQKYSGPYIVELIDSTIIQKTRSSREALLLMEYYPGGHLLDRLLRRAGNHLSLEGIFRIFGQLCLALRPFHMSSPPIAHRDIKLENILFGTDGKVRLCDFGSCTEVPIHLRNAEERQAAEERIAKETTQSYRAPEMVDLYMRKILTEKTDIWALGCILYAICFLAHPFQDGSTLSILNAKIVFPANSPFSADMHTFILRMLDIDPECRPDLNEVIVSVRALALNQSLPVQLLSSEAQQCRADRLAANVVRETSRVTAASRAAAAAKKSPGPGGSSSSGKAVAVPIAANSVAARRLAAKRGQSLVMDDNSNIANLSQHQISFAAFDDNNTSSAGYATFDAFDASSSNDVVPTTTFSVPSTAANTSEFDPFSVTSSHNYDNSSSSTAAFNTTTATAAETFTEFDDDNSYTTQHGNHSTTAFASTSHTSTVAAPPAVAADDFFFAAADNVHTSPVATTSSASTAAFNPFDDDISDSFVSAATITAAAAKTDDSIVDLFDVSATTSSHSNGSHQHHSHYSAFDNHTNNHTNNDLLLLSPCPPLTSNSVNSSFPTTSTTRRSGGGSGLDANALLSLFDAPPPVPAASTAASTTMRGTGGVMLPMSSSNNSHSNNHTIMHNNTNNNVTPSRGMMTMPPPSTTTTTTITPSAYHPTTTHNLAMSSGGSNNQNMNWMMNSNDVTTGGRMMQPVLPSATTSTVPIAGIRRQSAADPFDSLNMLSKR